MVNDLIRVPILVALFSGFLWIATGLTRDSSLRQIGHLEGAITADWKQLAENNPELRQVQEIQFVGSMESGLSRAWARQMHLDCLTEAQGALGAEIMLLPVDLESGLAANVQIYLYELDTEEFVKEISRQYPL